MARVIGVAGSDEETSRRAWGTEGRVAEPGLRGTCRAAPPDLPRAASAVVSCARALAERLDVDGPPAAPTAPAP